MAVAPRSAGVPPARFAAVVASNTELVTDRTDGLVGAGGTPALRGAFRPCAGWLRDRMLRLRPYDASAPASMADSVSMSSGAPWLKSTVRARVGPCAMPT